SRSRLAPMERLLTRVSSAERTPAAGSAATAAAALSAALVTKVARRSREVWPEGGGAIAQAAALDSRLWVNAAALEMSYEAATEALETSNQPRIAETLPQAAEDSLELGPVAARLPELAALCGGPGPPPISRNWRSRPVIAVTRPTTQTSRWRPYWPRRPPVPGRCWWR